MDGQVLRLEGDPVEQRHEDPGDRGADRDPHAGGALDEALRGRARFT